MDLQAQIQFIGNLLVEKGLLTQTRLEELQHDIADTPSPQQQNLEHLLIHQGLISEEKLLRVYSEHLGIPFCDFNDIQIDPGVVSLIPAKFANKNRVIAIKKENDTITVALRDPFNIDVIDDLKIFTKLNISPVIGKTGDITGAIKLHYGVGAETVEELVKDSQVPAQIVKTRESSSPQDLEEMAQDASMVNYVNQLISEAYQERATDIHIEPFENRLRIRYRIDGILHEAKTPQEINKLKDAIISRFKIMSNLNIAEKRRSQDGRCKMKLNNEEVDLRLSTFPTLYGEGLSIRILSRQSILLGIDQLGLSQHDHQSLADHLQKPNGIILVTGPTGCGKTTTLYACINHLNNTKINIVTLEDPIEYQLEGVNQIQTNPKVELTFANGFRSVLRQDPDVILVGEIRDLDTAQIAIRAALTGHLIFSTLHTNNALETLTRLLDLGIEPYLVTSTLRAVIAQRLVRVICEDCKQKDTPSPKLLAAFGFNIKDLSSSLTFYRGKGCPSCNDTGYKGRLAIFELLTVDEKIGELIIARAPKEKLKRQAAACGMKTLKEDGLKKAKRGLTTLDEVLRVTE